MTHQPKRHNWRPTGTPAQRGYGAKHNRIRRAILAEQPVCASPDCDRATCQADHIKPLCLGGPTERENMQGLCLLCARSKTGREGAYMRWHVHRRHLDRGNGPGGRGKAGGCD